MLFPALVPRWAPPLSSSTEPAFFQPSAAILSLSRHHRRSQQAIAKDATQNFQSRHDFSSAKQKKNAGSPPLPSPFVFPLKSVPPLFCFYFTLQTKKAAELVVQAACLAQALPRQQLTPAPRRNASHLSSSSWPTWDSRTAPRTSKLSRNPVEMSTAPSAHCSAAVKLGYPLLKKFISLVSFSSFGFNHNVALISNTYFTSRIRKSNSICCFEIGCSIH